MAPTTRGDQGAPWLMDRAVKKYFSGYMYLLCFLFCHTWMLWISKTLLIFGKMIIGWVKTKSSFQMTSHMERKRSNQPGANVSSCFLNLKSSCATLAHQAFRVSFSTVEAIWAALLCFNSATFKHQVHLSPKSVTAFTSGFLVWKQKFRSKAIPDHHTIATMLSWVARLRGSISWQYTKYSYQLLGNSG